ncbi:DsbA family protein [Staphylococcus sp. ACRSN]|uniref:thioredoxin domain-containing protein n=1 Tax=Staphylococcus sp. ACRSN TaxID=2918214 RepID=UPI001EF173FC|nr:thioredoxin domain-containing protein [Staphylococcus sp. ACRSN]MCG7338093.1 DsbA family protein [Staphylococcus sp. ACRSN]
MTEVKHLTFGDVNAPITVESFINFACPYCKNYFKAADRALSDLIKAGKVKHSIKHFDKTKQGLLKGTIANIYLDYEQPEETLNIIHQLYDTQEDWKKSFTIIEQTMEQKFNLKPQKAADERSLAIAKETFERGIGGIPTVFIDGNKFEFNPLEDSVEEIATKLKAQLPLNK